MKREMTARERGAGPIDEYIAGFPADVQKVLQRVRAAIRKAAPQASESISYRIPTYKIDGRVIVYFAGFKHHIGLYPPVRGDAALEQAVAPYAGEKGNLRFPLDERIPYSLISRIVTFTVKGARQPSSARARRAGVKKRPTSPFMTADDFRRIALAMTDATEGAHMNHPDFRVGGRIFATLHPDLKFGMVKLTQDQQRELVASRPDVFEPEKGAWGVQGYTAVRLSAADDETVGEALTLAWRNCREARTPARRTRTQATKRR